MSVYSLLCQGLRSPEFSPKCLDFWRREDVKGRVYLLDLNNIKEGAKELKVTSTSLFNADTFNPHGISVWQDKQKGECLPVSLYGAKLASKGISSNERLYLYLKYLDISVTFLTRKCTTGNLSQEENNEW